MHKFYALRLGLMNKADDTVPNPTSGDAAPTVAEAIAAVGNTTMPITQRLGVALKALQGINIDAQLATVKADLVTAQTALTAAQQEVASLKKEKLDLEAKIVEFQTSAAALEKENKDLAAKEQDIEKRAASKTKEQMAGLGFPSNKLPPAQDTLNADEKGSGGIYKRFKAEADSDKKAQLYQDYQAALAAENKAKGVGDN